MESEYTIITEMQKGGFVHIEIIRASDESRWGGCLEKDADLNAPLPCMFADEPGIVPILIAEDVKAAILAKWAELGRPLPSDA